MTLKAKKKTGRPSKYTDRIAARICSEITNGKSLVRVCEAEDMPSTMSVYRWLGDDRYKTFRDNYAHACEERTEALVEEAFQIASDGSNDWMEKHYGNDDESSWVVNGEAVQRSRLRVDLIKWYASRMKPKKYGDKIDVSSGGNALPTPIIALPIKDAQSE